MNKPQTYGLPEILWAYLEPNIPKHKASPLGGRPRIHDRTVMNAIFFLLVTGSQWKSLHKSFGVSSSTAHSRFKEWIESDVFRKTWRRALKAYDKAKGIDWQWMAVDGAMTKAPLGGEKTGSNPTDRSKRGTKRSLLTDRNGIPLSVVVDGANRHDMKLIGSTLSGIVIGRPSPKMVKQNLCLDKGYDYPAVKLSIRRRGYISHLKTRKTEIVEKRTKRFKPKRWVVERTHSWINRFRRLLIRWEKKIANYTGFLELACAFIVARSIG